MGSLAREPDWYNGRGDRNGSYGRVHFDLAVASFGHGKKEVGGASAPPTVT